MNVILVMAKDKSKQVTAQSVRVRSAKGLVVTLDRQKRIDFCTGFKRRKDERRKVAIVEQKKEASKERHEFQKQKSRNRQDIEK